MGLGSVRCARSFPDGCGPPVSTGSCPIVGIRNGMADSRLGSLGDSLQRERSRQFGDARCNSHIHGLALGCAWFGTHPMPGRTV